MPQSSRKVTVLRKSLFALLIAFAPLLNSSGHGEGPTQVDVAINPAADEENYLAGEKVPESIKSKGIKLMRQRRYRRAFSCFQSILDKYPNYSGYMQVVGLEFQMAKELMDGKRTHLFWGRVPWLRDRSCAIEFFQKIVERVPYGDFAPSALMNVAHISLKRKDYPVAVAALEKLVDEYGNSPLAPNALLLLGKIYRSRVPGAEYDQKMTHEAINCYNEFLVAFPDSPMAQQAEELLAEATDLLARGTLSIGNFYYDARRNPRGAKPYYDEILRIAQTDSPAALEAEKRLADIASGKRGKGSPLDFILGPYRQSGGHGDLH